MSLDTCALVSSLPCLHWSRPSNAPLFPSHLSPFFLPHPCSPDTGDRPYKCQHCGDQFARRYFLPLSRPSPDAPFPRPPASSSSMPIADSLFHPCHTAIFSPAISTNVTLTRNLSSPPPQIAARALPPPVAPPPPNRPATSVSSPASPAMVQIPAVRPSVSFPSFLPLPHASVPSWSQPNVFIGSVAAPTSNFTDRRPPRVPVILPGPPTLSLLLPRASTLFPPSLRPSVSQIPSC